MNSCSSHHLMNQIGDNLLRAVAFFKENVDENQAGPYFEMHIAREQSLDGKTALTIYRRPHGTIKAIDEFDGDRLVRTRFEIKHDDFTPTQHGFCSMKEEITSIDSLVVYKREKTDQKGQRQKWPFSGFIIAQDDLILTAAEKETPVGSFQYFCEKLVSIGSQEAPVDIDADIHMRSKHVLKTEP